MQLSQANAKLSSESTSARARAVGAEEAAEKAGHDVQVWAGQESGVPMDATHWYGSERRGGQGKGGADVGGPNVQAKPSSDDI